MNKTSDDDFKVQTYCGPRNGGFVNRDPEGVKITHKSGLSVSCHHSNQQHINRAIAMKCMWYALGELK